MMELSKDYWHCKIWAMVLVGLISVTRVESRCTKSDMKFALHRCNAELSYINNAVLSAKSNNFSLVCSAFSAFILCVDPKVAICQNKMMKPYMHTRSTYSKPPYNCSVPPQTHFNTPEGKRQYRGEGLDQGRQEEGYGFTGNSAILTHSSHHLHGLLLLPFGFYHLRFG